MQADKYNGIKQCETDVLYLINCALHGKTPDIERVVSMRLDKVYHMSIKHMVAAMTYYAIEPIVTDIMKLCENENSEKLRKLFDAWKDIKNKAVRKVILLDIERSELFRYMDEEGIWYMPLKGVVLKDLYPAVGMRQMSDNDILFDGAYQSLVRDYFISRGFVVEKYGVGNHDVYMKEPVYNYEMHTELFEATHCEVWADYYSNVKERLVKDEGNRQGYHFTDEDFYIYFVNHAYKHNNKSAGTGIRSYIDCYVFLKGRNIDWEYVEHELKYLGIYEFEKVFRSVSLKLFDDNVSDKELDEKELELLAWCMDSGVYGTFQNYLENRLIGMNHNENGITTWTKLKYFMKRIYPGKEWLDTHHPVICRFRIILPVYLIYRIIKGIILHGGRIMKETAIVWKTK